MLAFAVSVLTAPAADAQVSGRATAIGADVLRVNGQSFALRGVDAVEFHQSCYIDGRPWTCGVSAVRAFQTLIDPVVVTCTPTAGSAVEPPLAVCTSSDGDLAEIMVRQGWARAYGPGADQYAVAEEAARVERVGIWQGHFIDPWQFRDDMLSIERAYALRTADQLAAEAASRLAVGDDSPLPFRGFEILSVDGANLLASAVEIRLGAVPYGTIRGAVGPEEVFDWTDAADALSTWRQQTADFLERAISFALWTEFHALPGPTIEVADAVAYYDAMMEAAAPLLAAGRQPILLVSAIRTPNWIGDWLAGSPPAGATILRTDEPGAPTYRGTINGVDIHVGPAPLNTSLVFPDDILIRVVYGQFATGSFVTVEIDAGGDPAELVLRYSRTFEWSSDSVIRIGFPGANDEEDPFYEVESP
jgi:endonuclease YncB( thermonuclease family)